MNAQVWDRGNQSSEPWSHRGTITNNEWFLGECWCWENIVCVCEFGGVKRVWTSAFDFHASDNISSPAGKQFIRPSGALFNGSLQATAVLGLLCCGRHADHQRVAFKQCLQKTTVSTEPHLKPVSSAYSHCLTVYDSITRGLCTVQTWTLRLKTNQTKMFTGVKHGENFMG